MSDVSILANGLRQIGQAYIERPDFTASEYRTMVENYLLATLVPDRHIKILWADNGLGGILDIDGQDIEFGPMLGEIN